jgi:hypothetical protein
MSPITATSFLPQQGHRTVASHSNGGRLDPEHGHNRFALMLIGCSPGSWRRGAYGCSLGLGSCLSHQAGLAPCPFTIRKREAKANRRPRGRRAKTLVSGAYR